MTDSQNIQAAKAAMENLAPEDKAQVSLDTLDTLPTGAIDAKKDVATAALQALPESAIDAKKGVAAAALQALPPEAKKDVVTQATQKLPAAERQEVAESAGHPSQRVTDWVWQIIVGAFAIAFLFSAAVLFYDAAATGGYSSALLLPVFTTLLGTLAGFLGGRASGQAGS